VWLSDPSDTRRRIVLTDMLLMAANSAIETYCGAGVFDIWRIPWVLCRDRLIAQHKVSQGIRADLKIR